MKRGLLYCFMALFLLPVVLADISLQGPGLSTANIGDELHLSGYLLQDEDMTGLFKLVLSCSGDQPLLTRFVSLKANQQKSFTEVFPVPATVEGDCVVSASFESNGVSMDTESTSSFVISHELTGGFSVSPSALSLGEELVIEGQVTTQQGEAIDGTATPRVIENCERLGCSNLIASNFVNADTKINLVSL